MSQYGALLMVDLEEEYYSEEVAKLHRDVEQARTIWSLAYFYSCYSTISGPKHSVYLSLALLTVEIWFWI